MKTQEVENFLEKSSYNYVYNYRRKIKERLVAYKGGKCEICGRTIEEAVVTQHKFQAKRFCLDHNHDTHQFRGLLCSCCNRQLGWYEKYRIQISKYLDKDLSEQNKNI